MRLTEFDRTKSASNLKTSGYIRLDEHQMKIVNSVLDLSLHDTVVFMRVGP